MEHFSKENKAKFADRHIEFTCRKGQMPHQNQDNYFIVIDGDIKIFGLFDGNGVNGHLISSFAMGEMLKYIKNSHMFREKSILGGKQINDQEITRAIRCCFKYTQEKTREQYKQHLINLRKKATSFKPKKDQRNVNNVGLDSNSSDVSFTSDEIKFMENISWDTASFDGNSSQEDDENKDYDPLLHTQRRKYCSSDNSSKKSIDNSKLNPIIKNVKIGVEASASDTSSDKYSYDFEK